MKICSNCGHSNADSVKFCGECGKELSPTAPMRTAVASPPSAGTTPTIDVAKLARSISATAAGLAMKRKADVMFILDCTGSMQGEIDAIRDAITSFADTITGDGVRVRVGLVEFRDRLIDEEHQVLTFEGQPFTTDPTAFRRQLSALKASGGGDEPESSLDAIMLALDQDFAPDSQKVLVLITDAPPHIPDKETKTIEEVVTKIQSTGINQFYLVIRAKEASSQVYLKLLEGTRGMAFDLGTGDDFRRRAEDFKRTLMALGKTISEATR
ncbi:MAG: VWA domain-containing protein [Nostocales cyanobacterium LE14-WE4]|jgi:Mg-chelatase subunit ChlD|nr:VWA domain-containing protein [Anabaena sp. 49633_E8]MCE2703656.1 VWA domain-containing protein [Anabaena sp. 49633_E8]MDJ0501345.1 VWA domain-containing protein [Nostocales cyanobacterium LE14-WE4]